MFYVCYECHDIEAGHRSTPTEQVARDSTGDSSMKITQKIIDDLTIALAHTKKDGTENWKDGDEIDVCLGGTFANDKFISLINRSKDK